MLDNFTLSINNTLVDLKSYSIRYNMFEGAASFQADIDPSLRPDLTVTPLQVYIEINGWPMFSGYVDKVDKSYSKGNINLSISGRDMMQVLIDNYVMEPHVYPGKASKIFSTAELWGEDTSNLPSIPFGRIVTDIYKSSKTISLLNLVSKKSGAAKIATMGINKINIPDIQFPVYAENATTSDGKPLKDFILNKVRSTSGQSLFEFISYLCNGLGMYLYNIPGTRSITIHKIQTDYPLRSYDMNCTPIEEGPYKITNALNNSGNNVISGSYSQDTSAFHKFIRLIGQCESEDVFSEEKATSYLIKEKLEGNSIVPGSAYDGVTKFKCNLVNVLDGNVWYKEQERLMANEFMQQNQRLYNFQYTMSGHSPSQSNPYFFNHAAVLTDDYLGISNQQLLVYAVEFTGSKDEGQKTNLSLYSPSFVPHMISQPSFLENVDEILDIVNKVLK